MLGLFNIFGRAESLKALDQALREFGVHPRTVPEAVKLAAVKLVQNAPGADPGRTTVACADAGELLSYCILGHDQFVASNDFDAAVRAEKRLDSAIEIGDGLDADLILLALHANIISPKIAERFEVETD